VPEIVLQGGEQLLQYLEALYSQVRWLHFDDASRLVTRVGYLDDGWIRVRIDGGSALDINLVEVLRELSWTLYDTKEMREGIVSLKGALESIGADSLRVVSVGLFARDYDYLRIDLSRNRSDELIAQDVVTLCVVDAGSGATYTIKLFDPSKPGLDQVVLKPGFCIDRLWRANVYLSNSPQPGSYLKLLLLKGW